MQGQDAAFAAGAIGGMLCGMAIALILGTLIGSVILRAACSFFNRMTAADNHVPEPSFGKAMGIVFAATLVNLIVSFGIGLVFGAGGAAGGMDPRTTQIVSSLISLPAGFLVMAGMLTAMLPTSFGRAALVTILTYVVAIAIAVIISLLIAAVVVGLGFAMRGAG